MSLVNVCNDTHLYLVSRALSCLPQLEELTLKATRGSPFGVRGLDYVRMGLLRSSAYCGSRSSRTALKMLSIWLVNPVDDTALGNILSAIVLSSPDLETVDFPWLCGEMVCTLVLSALVECRQLKSLLLGLKSAVFATSNSLSGVLLNCSRLRWLELPGLAISEEVCDAPQSCAALECLNLGGLRINVDSALALGRAMIALPNSAEVNLGLTTTEIWGLSSGEIMEAICSTCVVARL